jgi:hypothetical protein
MRGFVPLRIICYENSSSGSGTLIIPEDMHNPAVAQRIPEAGNHSGKMHFFNIHHCAPDLVPRTDIVDRGQENSQSRMWVQLIP